MEQDILLSCSWHLTIIYFNEHPTALDKTPLNKGTTINYSWPIPRPVIFFTRFSSCFIFALRIHYRQIMSETRALRLVSAQYPFQKRDLVVFSEERFHCPAY